MEENQNSNSPKDRADIRFTAVMAESSTRPSAQIGVPGSQVCRILAPPMASIGTTATQKYQYSQPLVKPAQSPRPRRVYSVKLPSPGAAAASSLSMRMMSRITSPASA